MLLTADLFKVFDHDLLDFYLLCRGRSSVQLNEINVLSKHASDLEGRTGRSADVRCRKNQVAILAHNFLSALVFNICF